jgi:hypothetical protein
MVRASIKRGKSTQHEVDSPRMCHPHPGRYDYNYNFNYNYNYNYDRGNHHHRLLRRAISTLNCSTAVHYSRCSTLPLPH